MGSAINKGLRGPAAVAYMVTHIHVKDMFSRIFGRQKGKGEE